MELVGVAQVLNAFGGAHVQPDAKVRARAGCGEQAKDAAVIPPEAGREDGEPAEDRGVDEAEVERDEATEGRAAEGGAGGFGLRAKGAVDERLELFDEEAAVAVAIASAQTGVAGGGVFGHPAETGVVDADEDEGFDLAVAGEAVGGGVGAPGVVGDVGGAAIKEVLAVVEVEDGEAAPGFGRVGFGQVDHDVAVVGKKARVEVPKDEEARVSVELVRGIGLVVGARGGLERREGTGGLRFSVEGGGGARICETVQAGDAILGGE